MIVLVSIVIVSKGYSFGIFCALEQKVVRRSAGALSRTLIQIFCSSLFFQQNRQAQVILSQRLNINLDEKRKSAASGHLGQALPYEALYYHFLKTNFGKRFSSMKAEIWNSNSKMKEI